MRGITLSLLSLNLVLVASAEVVFSDITNEVFTNGTYSCIISSFGDFNSDKLTDVLCINNGQRTVEVLFANDTQPHFGRSKLSCSFNTAITGVIPADFDGDSMMDALVTTYDETKKVYSIIILWGHLNKIECNQVVVFQLLSQPFIADYNDDIIPDVIGEDEEGRRCVHISHKNKSFTKELLTTLRIESGNLKGAQKFKVPHSCSLLDVNNDMVSDLVITGTESLELCVKTHKHFNCSFILRYPPKQNVIGQLTFVDLNTNGKLDYIIPTCGDFKCKHSSVMIWDANNASWIALQDNFSFGNAVWGFLNQEQGVLDHTELPITLRAGDFNLDGYPDFITVLENKDGSGQTKAVIFENVPCTDCPLGRSLKIHWQVPGLENILNVQIATFYDIFEDGTMDILASSKTNGAWQVHALKNIGSYDAYFIKVLILSGLCYGNCPSGHIPYGTNQPGLMLMFNTTRMTGDPLVSSAVQMSQTAHFPLQLPYSVFGLGQTPNFVDHLTVGIPQMLNDKVHKREWAQIIPNSQMVVIPYPPESERRWVNKLFLTPSRLMLLTFAALVGTCGFIALIIGILHWQERREDKKEKKQDAYRFHFDAM